jgi:hypothetical protein
MPTLTGDDLADLNDLADLAGAETTDIRLIRALQRASARFRGEVRHHVSAVDNDTVTLDGDGSRSLLLPNMPIRAVLWVIIDGNSVTDYRWFRDGRLRRTGGKVWPESQITVTYNHGYKQVPDDIVEAVLSQAVDLYSRQPGVRSMAVGGESVTFAAAGISEEWSQVVARYRIARGEHA